ncbi:MAG: hypothetical protein V4792_11200 [Pseudomonadota bacterium]
MNEQRVEQLLEEGNALRREALAVQREALSLQKEALAAQRDLVDRTRANLDLASSVNQGAAALQQRARRLFVWLVPTIAVLIVILIVYVAWIIFFRYR